MTRQTLLLSDEQSDVARAADLLRDEGIVACPSETVYGLCALATREPAVAKIFEAKNRPAINPLISHVSSVAMAREYVEWNGLAEVLAQSFWPGPLSFVLPHKGKFAPNVTANLPTAAVRMPAHQVFLDLIAMVNLPIAAPSANASGKLSPTRAEHVLRDMQGRIDAVIDGGASKFGLESSVVSFDNAGIIVLREGAITHDDLQKATGANIITQTQSEAPISPGQLLRHYAPKARLVLNSVEGERRLGFGTGGDLDLSPSQNLNEAAHNLFDMLHQLDKRGAREIHIAPIPNEGIGIAINDRLTRAARSQK